MSIKIISVRKFNDGREGFGILPVESPAAFEDLLKFVVGDYGLEEVERIDGPGSLVVFLRSSEGELSMVLNDMTGAEISGRHHEDGDFARRIAQGVEARIREVCG